jgi:hypothetical protein
LLPFPWQQLQTTRGQAAGRELFARKNLCIIQPPNQVTWPAGTTGLRPPRPALTSLLWNIYQQSSLHYASRFLNFRIVPIFDLGFMTNFFAQSLQTYQRLNDQLGGKG